MRPIYQAPCRFPHHGRWRHSSRPHGRTWQSPAIVEVYAYLGNREPFGLPNHLFSEASYLLGLVDELHCDRQAYDTEVRCAEAVGWANSKLFRCLKEQGVLVPRDFSAVTDQVGQAARRLRSPMTQDAVIAASMAAHEGMPLFDWDRNTSCRLAAAKLRSVWSILACDEQVSPGLADYPPRSRGGPLRTGDLWRTCAFGSLGN